MIDKKRVGSCNQCGNCCRDFVIDVHIGSVTDFEFTDYLHWINCHENVKADITSFKGRNAEITIKTPCKYLTDNGNGTFSCAINDNKPEICKRFPEEDYKDEISSKCGFRFVDAKKPID